MTTTTEATMDLTTMSPAQIDEILADLYGKVYAAEDALGRAWDSVHYDARDRKVGRSGWRLTNQQAWTLAEANRAEAAEKGQPWKVDEIQTALDGVMRREREAREAEAAVLPFEAEYARRPWTRFFVVSPGHIHSSMHCSTCNKGGQRTRFGWNPELSGKSMADAIAYFEAQVKGRSEVLCSVCFPDAPRAWMVRPVDSNQCPGSGTYDYDAAAKTTRRNYASGNGAVCTHCGEYRTVSSRGFGKLVKHKKGA